MIVLLLGDALTSEGEVTNNPESERAYELLASGCRPTRIPSYGDELVIVRSDTFTADDPPFRRRSRDRAAPSSGRVRRTSCEPTSATTTQSCCRPTGARPSCTSGWAPIPEDNIERVVDTALGGRRGPFDVTITGEWTADRDILQLSEDDLRKGEFFFGLPAALVILLLVFGALVAGLVPLLLAIVAIVVALALTRSSARRSTSRSSS